MSQTHAICKTKGKESVKCQRDRINELPDDILTSIVSYFNVRDAANASLLSSTWTHVCASISVLNFDWRTMFKKNRNLNIKCDEDDPHHCEEYKDRFIQGVNQFLQYYKGSQLVSFRVAFCLDTNCTSHIDQWVSFAISRGVQQLYLSFSCGKAASYQTIMYMLPPELLSHPNAAKIKSLYLNACILGPGPINQLSSLKTLSLLLTRLDEEGVESILSCCPNLESMTLAGCILPLKLCISGLLERLKLLGVLYCHDLEEIELFDTNLTTFEYAGDMIKFSFSRVPNLEKVFFRARDGEGMQYAFRQLAKDLPLVKNLSVYWELNLVDHLPEHMNAFNNVKLLELVCGQRKELDILKLIIILRACPLLEKFSLMMDCLVHTETGMDLQPKFFHKHLKEVLIGGFKFLSGYFRFAIYMLNYAAALEKMAIDQQARFYIGYSQWESSTETLNVVQRRMVFDYLKYYSKGATIIVN